MFWFASILKLYCAMQNKREGEFVTNFKNAQLVMILLSIGNKVMLASNLWVAEMRLLILLQLLVI